MGWREKREEVGGEGRESRRVFECREGRESVCVWGGEGREEK